MYANIHYMLFTASLSGSNFAVLFVICFQIFTSMLDLVLSPVLRFNSGIAIF